MKIGLVRTRSNTEVSCTEYRERRGIIPLKYLFYSYVMTESLLEGTGFEGVNTLFS